MIWLAGVALCILPFIVLRVASPFDFRTGPVFWVGCVPVLLCTTFFSLLNFGVWAIFLYRAGSLLFT